MSHPQHTITVKLSTGGTLSWDPEENTTRRLMTLSELRALAAERFGADPTGWRFTCPVCGHTAAVGDFPSEASGAAGFECLGRHVKDVGCDFAAFGLLPLAPWVIMPEDEQVSAFLCFALAEPEEGAEPLSIAGAGDTNE